jgi:hypothetical protein
MYGDWRLVRKAVDGDPLRAGTGWYDDTLVWDVAGLADHPPHMPHYLRTGYPLVNEGRRRTVSACSRDAPTVDRHA